MDLTKGSINKLFIRFLIPGISSMLGLSLYILVDTIFIGQGVGVKGLTALNITLPIFSMFICLGVFLGMGGATAFSVSIGKNELREAQEIFTLTIFCAAIVSLVFTFFALLYLDELCRFLGASQNILKMAKDYSRILIAFAPAFIFTSVLSNFCRNDHAPKLAMIAGLSGNFVNIILDALFIFVFHWGMIGAVLATVISPVLSVLILLWHLRDKDNRMKLVIPHHKIIKLSRIFKNGFPSFLDSIAPGLVIFSFNRVILDLSGDLGVAAYSVIANIAFVGNVLFVGTAQAIQPIIGQNFGAHFPKRVKQIFRLGLITAVSIGIIKLLFIWTFPESIIKLFNASDPALIVTARQGLRLYFIAMPFMAFNMIMVVLYQSLEKSKIATLLTFSRTIILVVAGLLFIPRFWGLQGVWLIVPLAEFITMIMAITIYLKSSSRYCEEI